MANGVFVFIFLGMIASAQAQNSVVVSAVGDIMMGTDYPRNMLPPRGGSELFKYAQEHIQAADIRFGNLEGTLYGGAKPSDGKRDGPNRYLFRTPPGYAQWLAEAGFNVMSLSNNHIFDFGAAGIQSTKEALSAQGVQYSSKRGEVASFNIRGVKVALIAADYYSGSLSISTPEATYQEIKNLSKTYDIVIVSVHAGREGSGAERVSDRNEIYLGENRGNSVRFARAAIDSGADLILMHGPHVPRGMEVYSKRLIAYSLGNFLTGAGISTAGMAGQAPLVRVQLAEDGTFLRGSITSFYQRRDVGVVYDSKGTVLETIKKLSTLDFPQSMPQFLSTGEFLP